MRTRRYLTQWLSFGVVSVLVGLAVLSCAPAAAPASTAAPVATQAPASGGAPVVSDVKATLVISAWDSNQEAFEKYAIPIFKQQYPNVDVVFDVGGSSARYNKLLAQKTSPTVDLFVTSETGMAAGEGEGLWEPVDPANVPNMKDIYPWAVAPNNLGAASGCNAYGLVYNTDIVKDPPTSWADFWRADLKDKVVMKDVSQSMTVQQLAMLQEVFGADPNDTEPGLPKLAELKPVAIVTTYTEWLALFQSGQAALTADFSDDTNSAKAAGAHVQFVVPKEGALGSDQFVLVVKGTKNKALAEAFMNVVLDPEVQAETAKEFGVAPTNQLVKLDAETADRVVVYGDAAKSIKMYDAKWVVDRQPLIVELMNEKVMPSWTK